LSGPLPPSWGALTKLLFCNLGYNHLTRLLPDAWSGMVDLMQLSLARNTLAGTVPPSWSSWTRIQDVELFNNPQLNGCLPAAWRGKVNMGPYKPAHLLTDGTSITGFC
jgi:hypothetical protein